jgi:AcrR family transcriptional regulator
MIQSNDRINFKKSERRVLKVAKGAAREQLLKTAETLFAKHGVDAVSLRAINAEAGVSPGVLHYHFGSREVLLAELISRGMEDLYTNIGVRLQLLKQRPQPTVQAVVEAFVLPLAELAINRGESGRRYLRFLARLSVDNSDILLEVSARYCKTYENIRSLLEIAVPTAYPDRLAFCLSCSYHIALQQLALLASFDNKTFSLSPKQKVRSLTAFLVAGLGAE